MTLELARYFDLLFGAEPPSSYAELRWKLPQGMGREFVRLDRREWIAALIESHGQMTDLYIGAAPRARQDGTRAAVERVHALWADLDTEDAIQAAENFHAPASTTIASGGGVHAYWALWPPATPDEAERANRQLAHALGADMRATDAARILRPPGTLNHKTDPPAAVEVLDVTGWIYTVSDVVAGLPDLPARERVTPIRPIWPPDPDDPLASIPAEVYVPALTGRAIGRDGKVQCPFHAGGAERTPSLHVYPDDGGWACFGSCPPPPGRDHFGGDIITFGAALYGLDAQRDFREIRRRVARELLGAAA